MRAFDLISLKRPLEDGAVEDTSKRQIGCKHFVLPDGRHRVIADIMPFHYLNGSVLEDINLDVTDVGSELHVNTGPYSLVVQKNSPVIEYTSGKDGSVVNLAAEDFGGSLVGVHFARETRVRYRTDTDLEIDLIIWPYRIVVRTLIKHSAAKFNFRWEYSYPFGFDRTAEEDGGLDASRRRIEVVTSEVSRKRRKGRETVVKNYEFTGRVRDFDSDRRTIWKTDPVYPLRVTP